MLNHHLHYTHTTFSKISMSERKAPPEEDSNKQPAGGGKRLRVDDGVAVSVPASGDDVFDVADQLMRVILRFLVSCHPFNCELIDSTVCGQLMIALTHILLIY